MIKLNKESLKLALNDGLALKNVPRVVKFNQKACLEPYIDMNTELKKKQKMILRKTFSSWLIIQFLEKLLKILESIEVLNLYQKKGEETICCQN